MLYPMFVNQTPLGTSACILGLPTKTVCIADFIRLLQNYTPMCVYFCRNRSSVCNGLQNRPQCTGLLIIISLNRSQCKNLSGSHGLQDIMSIFVTTLVGPQCVNMSIDMFCERDPTVQVCFHLWFVKQASVCKSACIHGRWW